MFKGKIYLIILRLRDYDFVIEIFRIVGGYSVCGIGY